MPQSPSLGFELLTSNQDSKHVTVNASALILEAVSIGVVVDQLNIPPASPTNGQLYIVGTAGTGAFLAQNNKLALYDSTTWYFYSPKINQTLYNTALASYVRFGGSTWAAVSLGGSTSPTTTKGDLIVRDNTTDVRQPVGVDGQVLTADSTVANGLKWVTPSSGTISPTTTKGDLIVRNATLDVRQPVGTDGQILTADSAQVTGVRWTTPASVNSILGSIVFVPLGFTYTVGVNDAILSNASPTIEGSPGATFNAVAGSLTFDLVGGVWELSGVMNCQSTGSSGRCIWRLQQSSVSLPNTNEIGVGGIITTAISQTFSTHIGAKFRLPAVTNAVAYVLTLTSRSFIAGLAQQTYNSTNFQFTTVRLDRLA